MYCSPCMTEYCFVRKPFFRSYSLPISFIKLLFYAVRQACVFLQAQNYHSAISIFCEINRFSAVYNCFNLRKLIPEVRNGPNLYHTAALLPYH